MSRHDNCIQALKVENAMRYKTEFAEMLNLDALILSRHTNGIMKHSDEEEAPVLPVKSGLVVLLGGGEVGTFLGGRGGSAAMTSGWLSKRFQMPPSGQTLCLCSTSSKKQDHFMPKAPCICNIYINRCKD